MDPITRQIIRDILHDKKLMTFAIGYGIVVAVITFLVLCLIQTSA